MSSQAATQPVGISRATSSAWDGPQSTATVRPVTSRRISLSRLDVPASMPLDTETRTASSRRWGATRSAVARTAKDGDAMTTSFLPATQAGSLLKCISGSVTPLSSGFSRVSDSVRASCSWNDHKVTSWPFFTSSRARAVPQPPLPTTAISISVASLNRHSQLFNQLFCFLWNESLFSSPLSSLRILLRCLYSTRTANTTAWTMMAH